VRSLHLPPPVLLLAGLGAGTRDTASTTSHSLKVVDDVGPVAPLWRVEGRDVGDDAERGCELGALCGLWCNMWVTVWMLVEVVLQRGCA